jgi:hypothetical protein
MPRGFEPTGYGLSADGTNGGRMKYVRMPIEVESPEEIGYDQIRYNLSESSVADRKLSD